MSAFVTAILYPPNRIHAHKYTSKAHVFIYVLAISPFVRIRTWIRLSWRTRISCHANEPARRAASRQTCCKQRWTL